MEWSNNTDFEICFIMGLLGVYFDTTYQNIGVNGSENCQGSRQKKFWNIKYI